MNKIRANTMAIGLAIFIVLAFNQCNNDNVHYNNNPAGLMIPEKTNFKPGEIIFINCSGISFLEDNY
jgi:hypothetical protein